MTDDDVDAGAGSADANDETQRREAEEARRREDEELRRVLKERGLVPTRAFIKDPEAEKAKSKSAARVARFRERQRRQGLVQNAVPTSLAEAVKAAGGWPQWEAALRAAAAAESAGAGKPRPGPVDGQRDPGLSAQDRADLDVGRRVRGLAGWRGRAVRWLLG